MAKIVIVKWENLKQNRKLMILDSSSADVGNVHCFSSGFIVSHHNHFSEIYTTVIPTAKTFARIGVC